MLSHLSCPSPLLPNKASLFLQTLFEVTYSADEAGPIRSLTVSTVIFD